jgi:hypothetical protein
MKNNILLIVIIFTLTNCKPGAKNCDIVPDIKCPILVGPRGAQILVSYESAKEICNNNITCIALEPDSMAPEIAQDNSGNILETVKGGNSVMVSKASGKYYSATDSSMQFLMYQGIGDNAYWMGLDDFDGKYYTLDDDSVPQLVGYLEKIYRTTPDSSKIQMMKGTGKNDYFAGIANGKIYKESGEGDVEQIGVFSYFLIPATNHPNLKRSIVMTKGMNPTDKWCGEMDGVIYIEK